jgi:maltose O-acetyltransferase
MKITIHKASPDDSSELRAISFAAKRVWNYPDSYFEVWKNELTITPDYIQKNIVNVAEYEGETLGYYSIVQVEQDFWAGQVFVRAGHWLEHIFIKPRVIKQGIGTELIRHAEEACKELGLKQIYIFSDPNAKGFYEKIGAKYLGESPSSIEGRTVSLFELKITNGLPFRK